MKRGSLRVPKLWNNGDNLKPMKHLPNLSIPTRNSGLKNQRINRKKGLPVVKRTLLKSPVTVYDDTLTMSFSPNNHYFPRLYFT